MNNNFQQKLEQQKLGQRNLGFTLIELMVAVAIIALLASVAYPAYTEQVRKSKRADLITDILQCAAILERRFTVNSTFATTDCDNVQNDDYNIRVTVSCPANGRSNCFTVTATPSNSFTTADTACASFTYNQLGEKAATKSGGADNVVTCWNT